MAPTDASVPPPRLLDGGAALEVRLNGEPRRFHAVWLRDNAQDASTRSPGNGQRLITLLEIPLQSRIVDARWGEGGLRLRFEPEGKVVVFDPDWLLTHAYDKPGPPGAGWTGPEIIRWDAGLASRIPVETYDAVRADPGARLRWLQAVRRYGVALLTRAPVASGAVCEVAQLFGYVRETNYGRWFDVRAKVDPDNLAYTNLGLQAHTDNPYRDPAPSLQLLACLENTVGRRRVDRHRRLRGGGAAAGADASGLRSARRPLRAVRIFRVQRRQAAGEAAGHRTGL